MEWQITVEESPLKRKYYYGRCGRTNLLWTTHVRGILPDSISGGELVRAARKHECGNPDRLGSSEEKFNVIGDSWAIQTKV